MSEEISVFLSCAREVFTSLVPIVLSAAGSTADVTKKRDGSLVTATDRFVESRIISAFSVALPGVPVLGEEGAIDCSEGTYSDSKEFYRGFLDTPLQLVVDPIDGTRNFVDGKGEYCIAAALSKRVDTGIWPIAAVVAIPREGLMLWCDGSGAFREELGRGTSGKLYRDVSPPRDISVNSRDRAWLSAEGYGLRRPWVSSGSSVYDFIGSATGRLSASIVGSQRLWDLMAPLAFAERLGLVLRDLRTGDVMMGLGATHLSSDLVARPWGLGRRMLLLPKDVAVEDFVVRPFNR